jgi:hypothetical protein
MTYQGESVIIVGDVTGRNEIQRLISQVLEPRLMSVLMAQAVADKVLRTLREAGYAVVPREPTKEMLDEGWYEANAENAHGVWTSMIEAHESSGNSPRGNG